MATPDLVPTNEFNENQKLSNKQLNNNLFTLLTFLHPMSGLQSDEIIWESVKNYGCYCWSRQDSTKQQHDDEQQLQIESGLQNPVDEIDNLCKLLYDCQECTKLQYSGNLFREVFLNRKYGLYYKFQVNVFIFKHLTFSREVFLPNSYKLILRRSNKLSIPIKQSRFNKSIDNLFRSSRFLRKK